jgi:hypothetical protein
MTKINWNREPTSSVMNSEYWTNPKTGFDKGWHDRLKQKQEKKQRLLNQKIDLGIHEDHDLDIVKLNSGPHVGKLICITCNDKFIRWLPKGIF